MGRPGGPRGVLEVVLHLSAAIAALQAWAVQALLGVVEHWSAGSCAKRVAHHLRSSLALLCGEAAADEPPFLSYAPAAAARLSATAQAAFRGRSRWTALALLDLGALAAVLWRHKEAHEAAAAASVRRAAADPGSPGVARRRRLGEGEAAALRCAALHAKAAYGAPAASGAVSSAAAFLRAVTLHQATSQAPRRIPAATHLHAVEQLTGVPPRDVLAAAWRAHLHRPAHYVALDRARRCVVVAVRGTLQLGDAATVLDAAPTPVALCGVAGHAHPGFLAAARNLLPGVEAALAAAASAAPGWPVLLCGHSLGGGVAAVLTLLLLEARQAARGACGWAALGEPRCVGVGAAAAFDERLGRACHGYVTSLLYGADCLPMFSVLGARMLIAEVHASSWLADAAAALLRAARPRRRAAPALARPTSAATPDGGEAEGEAGWPWCGGEGTTESGEAAPRGTHRRRGSSAWSSASTASLAAFADDLGGGDGGDGDGERDDAPPPPMFPPGRILWMLPPPGAGAADDVAAATSCDARGGSAGGGGGGGGGLGLFEVDQRCFQRFLVTLQTASHHLPDAYVAALHALAAAP